MEDKAFLVCMRADAPLMARGSSFDHKCFSCGATVMVAPTGQRLLKERANAAPLCVECYATIATADDQVDLAATVEEVERELSEAVPNFRSSRN